MKVYSRLEKERKKKKRETERSEEGEEGATRDVYTGVSKFSRSSTDRLHLFPVNVRRPPSHTSLCIYDHVSCKWSTAVG